MMTAAGGGALHVEDVFSTYLHDGTGSSQTITNNIDLAGEGGVVWIKNRSTSADHFLFDTERGMTTSSSPILRVNSNIAQTAVSNYVSANSDGFTLGTNATGTQVNGNASPAYEYVSWTFRKAPKFFDVVTYTGNGSTTARAIAHNLDSDVGFMVIKRSDSGGYWRAWHRSAPSSIGFLSELDQFSTGDFSDHLGTAPTSTNFYVTNTGNELNINGANYVAYLFAHNNGDGVFGASGDQDIIKCGTYVGSTQDLDFGFEPQWMITKCINNNSGTFDPWQIIDTTRGWVFDDNANQHKSIRPYLPDAEGTRLNHAAILPNGTRVDEPRGATATYIYIAIRRGQTKTPTDVDDVFKAVAYTANGTNGRQISTTPDPVDMMLSINRDSNNTSVIYNRKTGDQRELSFRTDNAQQNVNPSGVNLDVHGMEINNAGFYDYPNFGTERQVMYGWQRAPGYFDISNYRGTGASNHQIPHNLGVEPEMMWVKNLASNQWFIYYGDNTKHLRNGTAGAFTSANAWNNTSPTATQFTVGLDGEVNSYLNKYIAFLFASLSGISKIGTYSGSNSDLNIDCGFTNGAQFIFIKRIDTTGNWAVWDTARGIVSGGNESFTALNATSGEFTTLNVIEPLNSGFTVKGNINYYNQSGGTFLFYAIAA